MVLRNNLNFFIWLMKGENERVTSIYYGVCLNGGGLDSSKLHNEKFENKETLAIEDSPHYTYDLGIVWISD